MTSAKYKSCNQRSQVVDVYAHNEHTVLAQSSTNTKQQI